MKNTKSKVWDESIRKPAIENNIEIQNLIMNLGKKFSVGKGHVFFSCENESGDVLFIHNGCIVLSCVEKNSIIKIFSQPVIIGIREHDFIPMPLYKTLSSCNGYSICRKIFSNNVKKSGLCMSLVNYIGSYYDAVIYSYSSIHGKNAYAMIKQCIIEIYNLPEKIREEINVASYIIKRTSLSRSGVMKIISDLCCGKYIEINKGKLKAISYLPRAY
ncbi:TPA: helix-turn-helix domain-containing protein [Serratia marcescens]